MNTKFLNQFVFSSLCIIFLSCNTKPKENNNAVTPAPVATTSNADNDWAWVSPTPNVMNIGPFQFTVTKLTKLNFSDNQKAKLSSDTTHTVPMELEYEIKNTSAETKDIKGVFQFPELRSKETGRYNVFRSDTNLSFGGYYLDGYTTGNADAKNAYNDVLASGQNLSNSFEAGQTKKVKYFVYLVPEKASHFIISITPTDCQKCTVQLKPNQVANCEIKL